MWYNIPHLLFVILCSILILVLAFLCFKLYFNFNKYASIAKIIIDLIKNIIKIKQELMLFLLIIFIVGFILYIYSVEIYNYFIENYNECVKTLLNIFVNILQFLFMLIYSVWGLNFSFESLRLPLLFFGFEAGNEAENEAENEEAIKPVTINASKAAEDEDSLISGNSDKPTGSDNYIPTSASPPVNDAPQSMEDIIEGEPIKVSDNITNSSASDPAHISNSTSNNNDSELAPELGSAITQTPVEELSEEDRSVRD